MSEHQTKHLEITLEKAAGSDGMEFVLSSDAVDRVGDVIDSKALSDFAKSTSKVLALWQHSTDQPLGFWDNLKMEGGKLIGRLNLAPTNLGKMVTALLEHGTPLGASVGFRAKGTPRKDGGMHFKGPLEIFETSIVSVPCNRECMQIAKQYGIELPQEPVDALCEEPPASGQQAADAVVKRAKAATLAANRTLRKRK